MSVIPSFPLCVRAIAETALLRHNSDPVDRRQIERAGDYVLAVHERMPDHFRLALWILTLVIDASTLLTRGRPFHRLSAKQKLLRMRAWEKSRLGALRSAMAFYMTFARFSLYSDCYAPESRDDE